MNMTFKTKLISLKNKNLLRLNNSFFLWFHILSYTLLLWYITDTVTELLNYLHKSLWRTGPLQTVQHCWLNLLFHYRFSPEDITDVRVSTKWLYTLAYDLWSDWLPNTTKETVLRGGFYTVVVKPGKPAFRVIGLNSNFCYTENW